jgi:alpha-tubulin suppressor-like RCC1 family protein
VLYKITPPANKNIVQATVGNQNTFLITTDDEMYCTGWNTYGQCGLGHANEVNEPKKLDTSGLLVSGIKSITTGQYHTMVLTKQNQVIAWGRNRFGGLGGTTKFTFLIFRWNYD